jgi:hypothetical protein
MTNLKDQFVYIYSGENDIVMPTNNQNETYSFYTNADIGVPTTNIEQVFKSETVNMTTPPTEVLHYYQNTTFGDAISKDPEVSAGFSNEFNYDWASKNTGTLLKFDQTKFFPPNNQTTTGFADTGYFYYPSNCVGASSGCKLVTMLTDPFMDQKRFIDYGFPHIAADN